MDSPLFVAFSVFVGIFIMFFLISLLSDLIVIAIMVSSAVLAYFIPELYDSPNFQQFLHENLRFMHMLGISFPAQLDTATHYLLGGIIVFAGTLACVPVLPFSAVYRQMLGANKISRGDEVHVRALVAEELELIRQRVAAERMQQQQKALKRKTQRYGEVPDAEDSTKMDIVDNNRAGWLVKMKAKLHNKLAMLRQRGQEDNS